MRFFLAALALAGALIPFTPAHAAEPLVRIAQMPRDVTDAVRKQRERPRERPRADDRTTRGDGR
jgi:hypothetical protein